MITNRKTLIRIFSDAPPGAVPLPVEDEVSEDIPGSPGNEAKTTTKTEYCDAAGSTIQADTPVVRCGTTGRPVRLTNSFQCDECHLFHSLPFMAVEAELVPIAPVLNPNGSTHARLESAAAPPAPAVRHGICQTCYGKARSKRIWQGIGRATMRLVLFILAPFLPRPAENAGTPPAGGGATS